MELKKFKYPIEKNNFFYKSILKKKKFKNTTIRNFEFWFTYFDEIVFERVIFNKGNFSDISFKKCKFIECKFLEVNFSHCEFFKNNFLNCNFKKIRTNTILTNLNSGFNLNLNKKNNKTIFIKSKKIYAIKNKVAKNFLKLKLSDLQIFDPNSVSHFNFGKQNVEKLNINRKILIKKNNINIKTLKEIYKELIYGKGYVILKDRISLSIVNKAKKFLIKHNTNQIRVNSLDKRGKQSYVHNLFSKSLIFQKFIPKDKYLKVFRDILGFNFKIGYYSANILFPGARGQMYHLDYPYSTIKSKNSKLNNISFEKPINLQSLVALSDFDEDAGPLSLVPYSQKLEVNPLDLSLKIYENKKLITFKKNNKLNILKYENLNLRKGSIVLFNGLAWHKASDNFSRDKIRISLLTQYLPEFVKPMHEIFSGKIKISRRLISLITKN